MKSAGGHGRNLFSKTAAPTRTRSALEGVIDANQVSTGKRSGITNDPNREDDGTFISRLIVHVISFSLETLKIVKALLELGIAASAIRAMSRTT